MQQLSSSYGHKRTRFKTKASPTPLSIELRAPCMAWRGERRTLEEFRPFEQKRGRRREALEAKSVLFLAPSRGLPTQKKFPFSHSPAREGIRHLSPLFHSGDSSPRKRPSRQETLPPLCLHRKGGYRPTSKSAKKRLIRPVFPRLNAFLIHPFL